MGKVLEASISINEVTSLNDGVTISGGKVSRMRTWSSLVTQGKLYKVLSKHGYPNDPFAFETFNWNVSKNVRIWIRSERKFGLCALRVLLRWLVTAHDLNNSTFKGVLTWYRGDFHPGASSLRFPLMALYSFTWYQHKMSCRRESYRRGFTPDSCAGARFSSRHENSVRCHLNGVWLFVSCPLKFHQFYGTIRLPPQQTRLYVNTVQLFISHRNESCAVIM